MSGGGESIVRQRVVFFESGLLTYLAVSAENRCSPYDPQSGADLKGGHEHRRPHKAKEGVHDLQGHRRLDERDASPRSPMFRWASAARPVTARKSTYAQPAAEAALYRSSMA